MTNWYDAIPEDDTDRGDDSEQDAHYRHIVRAGMKVCLCGHIHPANFDGYGAKERIFHIYPECWMGCGCTEYRPSQFLAKQFTSDELSRSYKKPKVQPVVDLKPKCFVPCGCTDCTWKGNGIAGTSCVQRVREQDGYYDCTGTLILAA